MSTVKIGLFGFGVVGEGIYKVLSQKPQLGAKIKKIIIKQPDKVRNAPNTLFSTNAQDVLSDKEINLVVELIDDSEAAYAIVKQAMSKGKSVISANKKMVAEHHTELIKLSQDNNVSFLYEAAACGSIPIIRNLEEYFDNDLLRSIKGIVNGSTNYILSKMLQDNQSYDDALAAAQASGFAESNPSLDVNGVDAAYKLSIIVLHAFGKKISWETIVTKGITALQPFDFQYAKEKNKVIKLIAKSHINKHGELVSASVLPTLVDKTGPLGQTANEYNGVVLESTLSDEQFFYGKGAGRYPTSSAVLSDISAFKYGYKYEYKKGLKSQTLKHDEASKFYVGFNKSVPLDTRIFDQIDEHFINQKRVYLTGTISMSNLKKSDLLTDPNISIIALN